MARRIKGLFADDKSRTTVMLVCGAVSFLAAIGVAVIIWQAWSEIGIILGPRRTVAFAVGSLVGVLVAGSSGIWALASANRLAGLDAKKCIAGYLLDASALAIIGAFAIIVFFLRVEPV